MKYTRGSEWNRWDLHVHTPFSALNNQFGADWDNYVKKLFIKAIENNIKSIGITDYFILDGYKKLKTDYLDKEEKLRELFCEELKLDPGYIDKIRNILILPNIEFRLEDVIYYNKSGENIENKKLQYHIIFDNNISIEDIEDNFLHALTFRGAASCDCGVDKRPLTKHNIEEFGEYLRKVQPDFSSMSAFQAGLNCAAVSLGEILNVLNKNKILFKDKYILLVVEDDITNIRWGDQAHMTRKVLYSVAHAIFSSNTNTIKWGLADSTDEEFSSLKPCLWGSDAHEFEKLFNPDGQKYCWIKANPTFRGLLQVIYSPRERVYIGEEPSKLELFRKQKHQFIKNISIHKKQDSVNQEDWFENEIPLNIGLNAIIGNKGSGKSALSDIIGYLCSSKNMKYASFLNPERFRNEKKHYSDDYTCEITWYDEHSSSLPSLSNSREDSEVQSAQYLPQRYIETTCNNLGNQFQDEINSVIFSYIDRNDRGDAKSLSELVSNRSTQTYKKMQEIRDNIELLNKQIIQLEDKKTLTYKKSINEKLQYLYNELQRVTDNIPTEITKPNQESDDLVAKNIVESDKIISELETQIEGVNSHIKQISDQIQFLSDLRLEILSFLEKHEAISKKLSEAQTTFGIEKVYLHVDLNINYSGIDQKLAVLRNEKDDLAKLVSEDTTDEIVIDNSNVSSVQNKLDAEMSLKSKIRLLRAYKAFLSNQTTIEQQRYQKYLDDYKEWEKRISLIKNGSDNEEGIKAYEQEKVYLETKLPTELNSLYEKRINLITNIFEQLNVKVTLYQEIYRPVEEKLGSVLSDLEDQISFTTDILPNSEFGDNILSYINQRMSSDFQGTKQGSSYVSQLIRSTDFNDIKSVLHLVQNIFTSATKDPEKLSSLVKDRISFYNYISGLSYLDVDYTLKLGLKSLNELSPGERGTVLLVFYLALEKSNCPLIIDQPEDNLDNQSVYKKLVPCINKAKGSRQVIIVTHNPNIAIACDADEVIYSKIDKSTNQIRYSTGSIEDIQIRDKVVDILEGTEPAFSLRKLKYNI